MNIKIECCFLSNIGIWMKYHVSLFQETDYGLPTAVPQNQEDTGNTICKRTGTEGYEHRASKKRQNNNNTTMSIISDDGIQMTVFSKVENPVCFIKLDQDGNVL